MNFTENDRKLLMFMAESTWDLLHFKGGSRLQYRVSTMTELRKAVESERAEATINKAPHCQPIVCNRPPWHDKPKRAEPTATEPDVPEVEQCLNKHPDGLRCVKRATGGLRFICVGPCNFGTAPDVPEEGTEEERFEVVYAAIPPGFRVGTKGACWRIWLARAAQAKRDTEGLRDQLSAVLDDNLRLRETLKTANELAVLANNIVEKAGDA